MNHRPEGRVGSGIDGNRNIGIIEHDERVLSALSYTSNIDVRLQGDDFWRKASQFANQFYR